MNLLTTLTPTGEAIKNYGIYIGIAIIIGIVIFLIFKNRKKKNSDDE